MRSAFTMIEFIFVIVIIGILASIAAIKLSATRDDAKVTATISNIKVATSDIVGYAVAKYKLEDNILDMSDALKSMVDSNQAVLEDNQTVKIKMGSVNDCITFKIENSSANSILKVENGNANNDKLCKTLQQNVASLNYPITIKGSTLNRD